MNDQKRLPETSLITLVSDELRARANIAAMNHIYAGEKALRWCADVIDAFLLRELDKIKGKETP
jgi:hypothetical protein